MAEKIFVVCIRARSGEDLQPRKIYRVLPDKSAERHALLRVIDDSGDSYLYPQTLFVEIHLPKEIEHLLFNDAQIGTVQVQDIADLRRELKAVLEQNGVVRASVFGSFARGEQTSESDLDLLVEFKRGKSLLDLVGLKMALEKQLGRKADVTTIASLHPSMRDQILSEAISIYEPKRTPIPGRHPRKHRTDRALYPEQV